MHRPAYPYCDVDGSVGGEPGTCIAISCIPGEIKECRGDAAFTCSADGAGYEVAPCDLGCSDTPTPHCKYLQPKYLPDICDTPAVVAALDISTTGTLDPNVDTTCTGGVVSQGGADLCVVRAGTITIASASTLTIAGTTGMNGRGIAFVADTDLDVAGTIDVGAQTGLNGPGGGTYVSGGAPALNTQTGVSTAGGGAGGATPGGAGATGPSSSGSDGGGANGGDTVMNPSLLASFVGGASTVRPGDTSDAADPYFGGGGGALMLVSCHATVTVSGVLTAGGGGGGGGFVVLLALPGRGGGAGGNIVIQGREVVVTGQVFANGGGGGEGWRSTGAGADGYDGPASDTLGAQGGGAIDDAGDGGTGGWVGSNPSKGRRPTAVQFGPGGGGGSVGFLQTYTPNGVAPTLTPTHVSPVFQPNGTVELR